MRSTPSVLALIAMFFLPCSSVMASGLNPYSHCGTERWHIKTLDDQGVNHISQVASSTTIEALRKLPVPAGFSKNNDATRYAPVEDTKYAVSARLIGLKKRRIVTFTLSSPIRPPETR
jgi:hypothetical protein